MAMGKVQRGNGFEDRLARIQKGGANTAGAIQIGPRDEKSAKAGKADNTVTVKRKRKKSKDLNDGNNAVLVPLAVLLGGISMFVGQAAAFHLFQPGGLMPVEIPVPALEPYIPQAHFVFGGILAMMFAWTFQLTKAIRQVALVAGFGAVLYYQADLVQKFPGLYANMFSKEYVAAVKASANA